MSSSCCTLEYLFLKQSARNDNLYYNSACLSVRKERMSSKEVQLKNYTCACMLNSVLDNSGSRQGRETANPTCHEAMRVQQNEQVFTNI